MSIISVQSPSRLLLKVGSLACGGQMLGAVYSGKSGKSAAGALCRVGSW